MITRENIRNTLGSFWSEFFSEKDFISGWCQGMALHGRQLEQNVEEIRQLSGIATTPTHHIELWRPLKLVKDRSTGSFYPVIYDEDAAIYGAPGTAPFHTKEATYGGVTDFRGLTSEDATPADVMFITDSIDNPSVILVNGTDFQVKNGYFVFIDDITVMPETAATVKTKLYEDKDVFHLWGYSCAFDLRYAAQQWGYLLGFEGASSREYNSALWELWKARRFGLTPDVLEELLSIYLQCPRCRVGGEKVVRIVENIDGTAHIITDSSVYRITDQDSPVVEEGDVLEAGQFLGSRVDTFELSGASFIRDTLNPLQPYRENTLLTSDGLIETNYILFTADEAPATIEKRVEYDYTPAYAILTTRDNGATRVRVTNLYRFDINRFTLEIETAMLGGAQTQPGSLQIYSVTGVPLFSEPYTGSIAPVSGVFNFLTDHDDVLKVNDFAFTTRIGAVYRIALVSMFDDAEAYHIKSLLEGLNFTDNTALSVTIYESIDLYEELAYGGGEWFSIPQDKILDYNLVMVNTGSGYASRLEPDGSLASGPVLSSPEFITKALAGVDRQIEVVSKELAEIDADLLWLLNYVSEGRRPADIAWAYSLCGDYGTPDISSEDGKMFYAYGEWAKLDPEKVTFHETNNEKQGLSIAIPSDPWLSSTGSGVSITQSLVPIYSKRIDISSVTPRLETSFPRGKYAYKVSGVVTHAD